jgi:acetate kinase
VRAILVLNAGSSSIKFALYGWPRAAGAEADLMPLAHGQVAHAGNDIALRVKDLSGTVLIDQHTPLGLQGFDHDQATGVLFAWLDAHLDGIEVAAVGHRVVHGGAHHFAPALVDAALLQELDELVPLAPLHQPHNLSAIRVIAQRWPQVPQVACFDTAFHHTQPAVAQALALPRRFAQAGVRRYGFHGLSYEYIATQLPAVLGDELAQGRVIVAHLGNGASLCAMKGLRSVASSMGFSALDGLVMGTRCGSLDPGVVIYLMEHEGMDAAAISHLLYSESGLLGVSGISSDMRTLLESDSPQAHEAIDLFVYRVCGQIGQMAAALGGVDALVFTGGIGEHAPAIRQRIVQGCAWLGAALDDAANQAHQAQFHVPHSAVHLILMHTDEETTIARHALRRLQG